MNLTNEDKIVFLIKEMQKVEVCDENIIGMLSMLKTDDDIDEMIRWVVNTPNMNEEKFVKALIIVLRKDVSV